MYFLPVDFTGTSKDPWDMMCSDLVSMHGLFMANFDIPSGLIYGIYGIHGILLHMFFDL